MNVVEASIADLQAALRRGQVTSVELVHHYLKRIATYDTRGPCLNSIPILNPAVFDEAAASDARRAAGQARGPLEGIPYTIKDSMKYAGMTCAAGSPAFVDLVANEDCFVAKKLREAGCVCIGRTNTPPMMASGMHRGVYGRAESPYNPLYLTAAFSSGSSNGSATSTAASFAAFGLGSETVSSGRSPASNNGLVAYTPGRGIISPRGIWPLYPTCDVLVPHTRTVEDMLTILDTLASEDPDKDMNFWLEQKFVDVVKTPLPQSFPDLIHNAETALQGKSVGVPRMFIGGHDPKALPIVVSQDVIDLWTQARKDLEALGATVKETDFPLVTNYDFNPETNQTNNVIGFPDDWNSIERTRLVAYMWDDFLAGFNSSKYPSLASADGHLLFPRPEGYIPDKFMEIKNFMNYPGLVEIAKKRDRVKDTVYSIPGMSTALPALEAQRKRDLEDWMDGQGIDLVVFPANGDVGKADLDTNEESARHALQNGVKYSNGNRAIRHMGVPTVTVCMGTATSGMPVGLTFAGKAGQDTDLLRYAYAFEQATKRRTPPPLTPALPCEQTLQPLEEQNLAMARVPVRLSIQEAATSHAHSFRIKGTVEPLSGINGVSLEVYTDGKRGPEDEITISDSTWTVKGHYTPYEPAKPLYGGVGLVVEKVMIVVLLRRNGKAIAGKLLLLDQSAT